MDTLQIPSSTLKITPRGVSISEPNVDVGGTETSASLILKVSENVNAASTSSTLDDARTEFGGMKFALIVAEHSDLLPLGIGSGYGLHDDVMFA